MARGRSGNVRFVEKTKERETQKPSKKANFGPILWRFAPLVAPKRN